MKLPKINWTNILVYFFLLFFADLLVAQNSKLKYIDSLTLEAWNQREEQKPKALELANQALTIATKIKYKKGEGTCLNAMGVIYRNLGEFEKSETCFFKALQIREYLNDSSGIASVYNNLGAMKSMAGDYEKSIDYLLKAVQVYENINRKDLVASAFLNISNTFGEIHKIEKAIEYNQKSLDIFTQQGDSINIAHANLNLANKYLIDKNFFKAELHANEAIMIYQATDNISSLADGYVILAQVFADKNEIDKAKNYYESAIQINRNYRNDPFELFALYVNKAVLFSDVGKYNDALIGLRFAEKELGNLGGLEERLRLSLNYAYSFEGLGQMDSALFYHKLSSNYQDTLYTEEAASAIAEMQTKYETEKTERELAEEKLLSQKAQFQKNIFIGLFSIAFLISIFVYYYFKQRQKAAHTISLQNQKIHQQEVQELLKTQELTAINSMLEGQENERIRIAKDLHDRLGSMLTTVKWSFDSFMEKQAPKQDSEPLVKASGMLDDAYQEVRRIAHDMVSGVLTKFGLVPALQELARTISASGKMQVKVMSSGLGDRLDSKVEITLYRVVQELLSNILKHAQASETIVQLTRLNGELNITVEDNGKGFDPEKIKYGMGIKNIEARIQALDGSVFIDSGKGNGTTVMIDLPV